MFLWNSIVIVLTYFGDFGYSIAQSLKRSVLIRQQNYCGLCRARFSKYVPHEIHHLNHISTDNNSTNLVALCANCHSAHHRFDVSVKQVFTNLNATNQTTKVYYDLIK